MFCGSSPGNKTGYKDAAIELGRELVNSYTLLLILYEYDFWDSCIFICYKVSRNIDLVYGGGSIGLMGLISQAVYDGGRHVIGWVHMFCTVWFDYPWFRHALRVFFFD